MDGWVQIQVTVPPARVGEFHEMFGRWLQQAPTMAVIGRESTNKPLGVSALTSWGHPGTRPWDEGDAEEQFADATSVYRKVSPGARQIIDYWLDHPGEHVTGQDLARALDLAGPQVIAGTLASIGKRSKEVGRHLLFLYEGAPGGGSYWMESELVDLFRTARQETRR